MQEEQKSGKKGIYGINRGVLRVIQLGGLVLFLGAIFLFLLTYFMGYYRLDSEDIAHLWGRERMEILLRTPSLSTAHASLLSRYETPAGFLGAMGSAMRAYNAMVMERLSLNAQDMALLIKGAMADGSAFDTAIYRRYTHEDSWVEAFKQSSLANYGGWLHGRVYENEEQLRKDLRGVGENISRYGILSSSGFDTYVRADLSMRGIRMAAQGMPSAWFLFWLTYGLGVLGALAYILPKYRLDGPAGIKNNGTFHSALKSRGWLGMTIAVGLIGFYIILYFYPAHLMPWLRVLDPMSIAIKGSMAGHFFLYGFLYTLSVAVMGIRMMIRYRHSRYHVFRTCSLIFFQTAIAFLLPELLLRLNQPYFDAKNIWPLDYDFFFDTELSTLIQSGAIGLFMLGWGIGLIMIGVPVFTFFFGKRWYCSWVCGCGGLAETLGDPFRHLSDKSLKAWRIERYSVHGVLVFAVLMTVAVLYTYATKESIFLGIDSYALRKVYGFLIGALFAGVIGTGFYPIGGSRVWCRFGCPLAAYLGLIQRFRSRFRITTNGGQCISCGNCSTYCEMGIDVKYYAQRGQPVVRASCVGCGVCASVCPRGVLRLENKKTNRFDANLLGLSPTESVK